jgi:acyl carrier protein
MDRAAIKEKLAEILERSVGEATCAIEETTNLKEDLNLDSVDVVTLAVEVQSEFRVDIKTVELMKLVLVKDLIDLIQNKSAPGNAAAA